MARKNPPPSSCPIFVICPRPGGGWQVKQEGIRKNIKAFLIQKEAIQFARGLAHDLGGKVIVRGLQKPTASTTQKSAESEILKNTKSRSKVKPGFGGATGLIFIPPEFDDPIEGLEEYI